jgi:hypothetical protein
MLGEGVFGAMDRVFGGIVGGAQALLVVWLTGGLLAAGPSPTLASQAQTSLFVRTLGAYLPAPTELAAELSQMLDETGLPDLFVGLEPIPAPPVTLPDDPLVQRLADAASRSTVKVTAGTCLSISSGTGFVVERDYVITNAHVGRRRGHRSRRRGRRRPRRDAGAVRSGPRHRAALRAGPLAPALHLATSDPDRGASGATFGFPGGLGLDVEPGGGRGCATRRAAGTSTATPTSRGGSSSCGRRIEQGDSGGPLVLSTGRSVASCSPRPGPTRTSATR